jgi:hypothetical protein
VADEAAPPERGVQLNERPQLRLVAPHPREQDRDAPGLPRRRRFRRPVKPATAAGPHGLRPRPLLYYFRRGGRGEGNRSKGLRFHLFDSGFLVEMEVTGAGDRDGVSGWFRRLVRRGFLFSLSMVSSFFSGVCIGVCLCAVWASGQRYRAGLDKHELSWGTVILVEIFQSDVKFVCLHRSCSTDITFECRYIWYMRQGSQFLVFTVPKYLLF